MPVAVFKKTKIFNVLKSTTELFKQDENINLKLTKQTDEDLWVYIDKEQLSRAILNLIKNSIQSISSDTNGIIEIIEEKLGNKAIIKIIDNGSGIPEDIRDKLFTPNFTTKSSGMGLGLAITKRIIENAQGSIRYETKIDNGTTFTIELPLVS
jgi:signal transduction histidine kinase